MNTKLITSTETKGSGLLKFPAWRGSRKRFGGGLGWAGLWYVAGMAGLWAQVAAPTFVPGAGKFNTGPSVVLNAAAGTTIYYTLNGTTPTTGSAHVSPGGSVTVAQSETLNAVAYSGGTASTMTSGVYDITGQVSAGYYHVASLRSDGTVWVWGDNSANQINSSALANSAKPVEQTLSGAATQISAGGYHTLALLGNGTVEGWGRNVEGELGDNGSDVGPSAVSGLSGVTAVAAGGYHSLALLSNGTVEAWGYNGNGQLGNGSTTSTTAPVAVSSLTGIVAIAAGEFSSYALKSDGTVWAWGADSSNQLGDNNSVDEDTPVQVQGLTGITAIAAGWQHAAALKSDGTVWSWGYAWDGEMGDGNYYFGSVPTATQAEGITDAVAIACGSSHTVIVRANGSMVTWGSDSSGQLANGQVWNTSIISDPQTTILTANVVGITAGGYDTFALRADGTISAFGFAEDGELGGGQGQGEPVPVQAYASQNITGVAAGEYYSAFMRNDGTAGWAGIYALGDTYLGGLSPDEQEFQLQWLSSFETVVQLVSGDNTTLARCADGTVWAWGVGYDGELGDGNYDANLVPTQVGGLSNIVWVSAGGESSLAVDNSGNVYTWGYDGYGELGDGATNDNPTATQVSGITGVTQAFMGVDHVVAIKGDGTVWVWGANDQEQLLPSASATIASPTQVSGITTAVSGAAGPAYSLVLTSAGTVLSWGESGNGETGQGNTSTTSSPAAISGLSNVTQVAAGYYHALALLSNGTVEGWGYNFLGQVGNNTYTDQWSPVAVSGLTNVTQVSAGYMHSLAVKSDGSAWAWGNNGNEQLAVSMRRENRVVQRLIPNANDTDQDGIPDSWEMQRFGSLAHDGTADGDADGFSDMQEFLYGTDPAKANTAGGAFTDIANPLYYQNRDYSCTLGTISGNAQHSVPSAFAYYPLVVQVKDGSGNVIPGAPVYAKVISGGGLLAQTSTSPIALTKGIPLNADSNGEVKVFYQQGATAGITSSIEFLAGNATATLTAVTDADADGNGLGDAWEIEYYGQTGVNPNALAPNGSGLTNLQCYEEGLDPLPSAPAEPFAITISATGPYQAPANPLVVTKITHPSTTTIAHVDFYDGATLLGTTTEAPWQLQLENLTAGTYDITAIAYDNTGATTSATTSFVVTPSNYYNRGSGADSVYYSSIVAVDSEKGVLLDGTQGTDSSNNFANLFPPSQYSLYPWFLRTKGEAGELWQHIVGITDGTPSYATFDVLPTANGTTVGGAPPLVAFGSQGGGTPLYTNQSYNFGIAAGGQLVFAPITISSVNNSTGVLSTASAHGLHVGQMIVISGATGDTALNGTFLVGSVPTGSELTLTTPSGGSVALSGSYTASSAVITNPDIKVDVYQASDFASGTKVAPVYTQAFTVPRVDTAAWTAFVANGYVQDNHIVQTYAGNTIDFDTQVQLLPGGVATATWMQQVNYPLLVTHKAANALFYYKVSYMGVTAPDDAAPGDFGTTVASISSDSAMAVDSSGLNQVWNVGYTLDFSNPSPWQSAYLDQPHFQGTPLPSAYEGESVDELIHDAPAVTDTLDAPGSDALNTLGLTHLGAVDDSPELRDHPLLDKFVASMNNDPMALANYVLNKINLTDAVGYDTQTGEISDTSINPQGVSRDALGTFLEGQGSPVEQDALLIYMLRKAGYSCGYVFPAQDQTLMFDEQLSKMLRMQIRGAEGPAGGEDVPELIPVNYPWVAAYINGKWIHIFPWIKDTVVTEGPDLWSYLPTGYQTGGQWLLHYVMNDPTIRQLKTPDGQYTDDVNTLFPLYVQNQLQSTGTSIDQLGTTWYNQQDYYTNWDDFPRPWQTPAIADCNLAQNLDYTQNPSALTPALQNIFDTISIEVLSDRNGNGQADAGEPDIKTGTMRMVDLHDRRLLLYHQVTSTSGANAPTYNLILSLEPFDPSRTAGPYTFNSTATYNGTANADPGDLMNQQYASVALQTKPSTDNPPDNDDSLLYMITYNRHVQAQSIPGINNLNQWNTFLGVAETTSITDTRYLRKGDMAVLCLNYGQVTPQMQEFQAEKYWNYQQTVAANPSTPINPELAEGQLLYIMGDSYYNKVSNLQQNVEQWTKTHAISWVAHGLSKLSPYRNADDTPNLINGALNLKYPRVDMSYQEVAWVGNSTTQLDSGDEGTLASNDADELVIGGGSADEHLVLNEFFQQASAISTVKLLDIAQGWTPTTQVAANPGSGVVTLSSDPSSPNYYGTLGTTNFTVNKTTGSGTATHTLEYWCGWDVSTETNPPAGSIWASIQTTLSDPVNGPLSTVFVTPGPVTAVGQAGQAYTGMGALTLGAGEYGAYITDNMVINNGGYAGETDIPFYYVSSSDEDPSAGASITTNVDLTLGSSGDYVVTYTGDSASTAPSYAPITISPSDYSSIYDGIDNSSLILTPDTQSGLNSYEGVITIGGAPPTLGDTGSDVADANLQLLSTGFFGSPSYYGTLGDSSGTSTGFSLSGIGTAVYDPVDAITGEFYVNALDIRLNGPMPLEIRRIYGSLNQASNNFGYGWRMSYFPYLLLSSDAVYNSGNTEVTTAPTLIYAAETDGSVIAYRQQTSPNTRWIPEPGDNPTLANVANGTIGSTANPFNNRIDETTVSGTTVFTLTGADGSVRTFSVQAYPTTGANVVSRVRPYLQKWTDNRGNYYTFGFGNTATSPDYGQVNLIQSSNGNFVRFNYDTYGHITQALTGDGRILSYTYDTYGDLTQVTLPDASTVAYTYQHATAAATAGTAVAGNGSYGANSATISSDNGLSITSATNANPSVLTTASAHGLQVGQIVTIGGATGNTAINGTYTVGTIPSPTTFTLLSGATPAGPFSTHLIVQETKPEGRILQNTYNSANNYADRRVVTQSATVGTNETPVLNASFSYGSPTTNGDGTSTGQTVITDVNNNTTTYKYTESEITEVDYPAQNTSNSNQASNGPVTTQTWYGSTGSGGYQRSLETRTDKRGLLSTYTYDGNGNLLTLQVKGNLTGGSSNTETSTTTMTYNSSSAVTLPGGGTAVPNTLASMTDQLGNGTTYAYTDSAHPFEPTSISRIASAGTVSTALLQYQDASGGGVSAYGLLQQQTLASGTSDAATTSYTYNNNGFPTSKTQATGTNDPNVVTTYTYDLRGEVTTETDAAGRSTHYSYDARGHRTGAERYDEWGNLISWNFTYYNQNGDVEWEQGPRYSPNDYIYKQYDGAGRLSQNVQWLSGPLADGSGVAANGYATTLYQHDTYGNLTEIDDPNQNATTMSYDAIGEMLGRVVHSGANSGSALSTESFTYEPGGQVATHTTMLGGEETRSYTYKGQLKTDAMPDGTTSSYLYDLTGRVAQQTLTNGSYWTTTYDDLNRVITRTFYNSSGTQLMQESQTSDRRGNVISKTDVSGNTFTTTYDGLNRVKTTAGPPAAGTTAQQTTLHVYDAANVLNIVSNGKGERTFTYLDALGRPTLIMVYNADGTTASNTGYWYSPDHQSVVTTVGSGSASSSNPGVTTTTFTDTLGHTVLVQHADGTFQATTYDAVGNKTGFQDEQGAASTWSYDALNRIVNQVLPGGATTSFTYTLNSPGETILRAMPGSLTAKTVYDSAGRKTDEELDGASSSVTRQYGYTYYSSGADKGLLDTVTDPRGFTTTTTYDAWLRPSTVDSTSASVAQQNQDTTYGYDNRGMVNSIVQSYASSATGAATQVARGFDAYGQINAETVSVNSSGSASFSSGNIVSQWTQSWDAAGHRTALNSQLTAEGSGSANYAYQYNALGLLTQVGIDSDTFSYAYGDNGLLTSRTSPLLTTTVTERDTRGRITAENDFGLGQALISESLTWRQNDQLASYTDSGPAVHAESRTYSYDSRERITSEPYYNPSSLADLSVGSQTALYAFDQTSVNGASVTNGVNVRTEQDVNANTGYASTAQNNFKQVTTEAYLPGNGAAGTFNWTYDAAGNVTGRGITSNYSQTLTWDAYNRLVKVSQRNSGTSDFDWTTTYDGLGRRVQTSYQPMNSGVNNGSAVPVTYYYDPQFEFLELGLLNGTRQWKVYGPDKSGVYGGAEGLGGIDGYVDETSGSFYGTIGNFFGDVVGEVTSPTTGAGFGIPLGGYGALPGNGVPDISPMWRSHYLDWTQFYYMGARYYDPLSGRFLSADPMGHDGSMSLYDYCNGDPVNGFDPDGLFTPLQYLGQVGGLVGGGIEAGVGGGLVFGGGATAEVGVGIPVAVAGGYLAVQGGTTFTASAANLVYMITHPNATNVPLNNSGVVGVAVSSIALANGVQNSSDPFSGNGWGVANGVAIGFDGLTTLGINDASVAANLESQAWTLNRSGTIWTKTYPPPAPIPTFATDEVSAYINNGSGLVGLSDTLLTPLGDYLSEYFGGDSDSNGAPPITFTDGNVTYTIPTTTGDPLSSQVANWK